MTKTLQKLMDALPARRLVGEVNGIEISGVTDNSREVQPGFVFVAYQGVATDAHKYIPDAIRRGAAVIVCEREQTSLNAPQVVVPNGREAFAWLCAAWHDFPGRSMVMIGVTGTDGKTTTTNLIFSILKAAGLSAGMISTVNAVIGERALDTGLHTTTPDADEVQGYLAQMRAAGMTHCVLEVTSHGLAQHRVDGSDFDVAVVTNITHDHLDLHGSFEAYRAAKGRLFEMAPTVVLNADDSFSFAYLRAIPVARQIVYSLDVGRAVSPSVALVRKEHMPQGMNLVVRTPAGEIELASALVGDFNVSNILAAVSAALALDLPAAAMQAGVAAMRSVPGRMERIDLGQPYTAIVDFAHTPNALEQALRTLREITPGKLIVTFGCAGERDALKRPLMGRVAGQYADVVVLTAEDPRRENLEAILDQVQAGVANPESRVYREPDREQAIQLACSLARPGDTVVACGKGHEQSMCFGTTETPWDDRVAMRDAVRRTLDSGVVPARK